MEAAKVSLFHTFFDVLLLAKLDLSLTLYELFFNSLAKPSTAESFFFSNSFSRYGLALLEA